MTRSVADSWMQVAIPADNSFTLTDRIAPFKQAPLRNGAWVVTYRHGSSVHNFLPAGCLDAVSLLQRFERTSNGTGHRRTALYRSRWRGKLDRGNRKAHGRQ